MGKISHIIIFIPLMQENTNNDPTLSKTIQGLRTEYDQPSFTKEQCDQNPFDQFRVWFKEAVANEKSEPNAMSISTATKDGLPSVRVVLLKELDEKGFVCFTHYKSKKGNS